MSDWNEAESVKPRLMSPVHAVSLHHGYEAIMAFDGREWHELDRTLMSKGIGFYPTHWRELENLPLPKPTPITEGEK